MKHVALLLFLLSMLSMLSMPAGAAVDATDYHQFWLWGGVHPQPALDGARVVYVLQGDISPVGSHVRFQNEGATPSYFPVDELWLDYRVKSLDWSPGVVQSIRYQWLAWQEQHNSLAGIQIDFDAHTLKLGQYAAFLRWLRPQLPPGCKLSITGLLDWTRTGDVATLNGLAGTVDEIVIQTYRGRHTVPDYERYLRSVLQLRIPFKIGLVQGGEWQAAWQQKFEQRPGYRGEVVFLLNPIRAGQ